MVIYLEIVDARITGIPQVPPNTVPPEVEDLILWAFGKAIIEFEATLFQKFNLLCGDIILNKNEFQWHLKNMEERGLVKSSEFRGVRSWSRIV